MQSYHLLPGGLAGIGEEGSVSPEAGDAAPAVYLQVDVKAESLHSAWLHCWPVLCVAVSCTFIYLEGPNALLVSAASLQSASGTAMPLGAELRVTFPQHLGGFGRVYVV